LVRRWEWLMLMPNDGRLPHTSQTAAIRKPHTSSQGTLSQRRKLFAVTLSGRAITLASRYADDGAAHRT
jgi:hypothetical protein